jgi:DNA repair exonuclease SbcCD ATPase subunit
MSIKLKKLVIENVNSYKGRHEIDFTQRQGNLVLIKGIDEKDRSSNGSGKSTLVDCIVLALFYRSLKKELNLDDLVTKSTKALFVGLTFVDSTDGVVKAEYLIERQRSKSPSFSKTTLYENGICISNDLTNTEIQSKIEQIIGMNYQVFVNNNVLNPELFKFVKGSSAAKIDILERVLNLNVVSKIYASLQGMAKEDRAVFDDNNREYYALKTALDNLMQQEESVTKNVNENIELLTAANKRLEQEIVLDEKMREGFSGVVSTLFPEIESKNTQISGANDSKAKLEHQLAESKKRAKYYETNEVCHTCRQRLPNRDEILTAELAKIKEFTSLLNSIINEIGILKASALFEQYNTAVEKSNECTRIINEKKYQIKNNTKTIEKFSNITSSAGQVEEVKAKCELAETEWLDSKTKFDMTEFWREMLEPKSKTRMSLAGDLLKVLNTNMQKYINNFYNKDFQFKFVITDSDITEAITINGEQFKYDQLSSGEKQKVDIVIVLSLLDIAMTYFKNNRLKFLIVDEALDHLDNVSGRYVIEFIKQYAVSINAMCIFISHHSSVDDMMYLFDHTITATKGLNGFSRIE